MNTSEVVKILAQRFNKPQTEIKRLLNSVTQIMRKILGRDEGFTLPKFGTFSTAEKDERVSYNPSVKKKMLLPPKIALIFKPSQTLKDRLNSRGEK